MSIMKHTPLATKDRLNLPNFKVHLMPITVFDICIKQIILWFKHMKCENPDSCADLLSNLIDRKAEYCIVTSLMRRLRSVI